MATVKTAISLKQSLFDRVEALAEEKHVSRSQLFAREARCTRAVRSRRAAS